MSDDEEDWMDDEDDYSEDGDDDQVFEAPAVQQQESTFNVLTPEGEHA